MILHSSHEDSRANHGVNITVAELLDRSIRSSIPAVTHVDYSARVQTVDAERNPRLHRLMQAFYANTGCPVLVNTSFNVRGEPIVCTPQEAFRCFRATDMDVLVLEDFILRKEEMDPVGNSNARQEYLAQFQLD